MEIYEDKDGMRKDEITALSGPNEFGEFYNRLKGIKEFHRRHPGEVSTTLQCTVVPDLCAATLHISP